MSEPQVK